MRSSETAPNRRQLGTSLLGYRRRDVEAHLANTERRIKQVEEENERLRDQQGAVDDIGHHIAGLLRLFAESVSAGEREAAAHATKVITDAEARASEIEETAQQLLTDARDLAAATYAEAGRRYEEVIATRNSASLRIEDAIEKMADALASLEALPAFLDPSLPVPDSAGRSTSSPAFEVDPDHPPLQPDADDGPGIGPRASTPTSGSEADDLTSWLATAGSPAARIERQADLDG